MTTLDYEGHPIRVRSRQFFASFRDIEDFLELVLGNIPEARLYDRTFIEDGQLPEITPSAWAALDNPNDHSLRFMFHDGNWTPEFETYRKDQPELLRLANLPSPSATLLHGVGIGKLNIEEIDRTIRRPGEGVLHTNDRKDDAWGKKIIDKVYRLSAKVFSNKAHLVDLVTGEVKFSVRYHNWYGRDLARLCAENDDLFLAVSLNREDGEYLGLRPDF